MEFNEEDFGHCAIVYQLKIEDITIFDYNENYIELHIKKPYYCAICSMDHLNSNMYLLKNNYKTYLLCPINEHEIFNKRILREKQRPRLINLKK